MPLAHLRAMKPAYASNPDAGSAAAAPARPSPPARKATTAQAAQKAPARPPPPAQKAATAQATLKPPARPPPQAQKSTTAQAAQNAPARPPPQAQKAATAATPTVPTAADLAKCNTQLAASQKVQKAAEAAMLVADGQKKKLAADLATSAKGSAALKVGCSAAGAR